MPVQNHKPNSSAQLGLNPAVSGASDKLDGAWSTTGMPPKPLISVSSKAGRPAIEATVPVPAKTVTLPLGQILTKNGLITKEQLEKAITLQRAIPDRYIGAILVEQGYISQDKLDVVLKIFNRRFLFGQLLVREQVIREVDLAAALQEQKRSNHAKKIGEILVERGLISEPLLNRLLSQHLGGPTLQQESPADESVARLARAARMTSPAGNPVPVTAPPNKAKPSIKFVAAVECGAGEVILAPEQASEKLFVVLSGEVKVSVLVHGSEVVLGTAKSGDVIGELPGLAIPISRLTFTAVGPVKLGIVNPTILTSEIAQLPVTTKYALKKLFMREKQVIETLIDECHMLREELAKQGGQSKKKDDSKQDMRMFVRRKLKKTLVQYRTHLGEFHGYVLNLSGGGMSILTRVNQPPESNVGVTFALPDNGKEISAKGTIVSSIKVTNGYRLGVKLTDFGYGAEKAIRWFTFNFPPEEKA
ncbi:MAG: PilZ domain-containing protein [Deltaproteobacteria bacterium]|nr:PilZ domain-containing protein [Deltaproteobacteria bacterium]